MNEYVVKQGQNIWDIAVLLYGTVEGVFDLLVSNPQLSFANQLKAGDILLYHPYFVLNEDVASFIQQRKNVPANNERGVYYKKTNQPLLLIIDLDNHEESLIEFKISGSGTVIVDWGDNSDLFAVELGKAEQILSHRFDSIVDNRTIKIYGDFLIDLLDIMSLRGQIYAIKPISIKRFVSNKNKNNLSALSLFQDIDTIDLSGMQIEDLSSLVPLHPKKINLSEVSFLNDTVLERYFDTLISNYGNNRRGCDVHIASNVTDKCRLLMKRILDEPEWNSIRPWKFIINGETYNG